MDCRVPKAVIRYICLLLLLLFSSSTVAFRTHEIDYQIDPAAIYTYCLPRHEVVSLPSKLRRKLLKYPSYDQRRLSLLPVDLVVSTTAVTSIPDELVNYKCNLEELMINNTCEFLPAYLDLLFGPHLVQVCPPAEDQDYTQTTPVVVSGSLGIMGQCICYNHVWLSVEGLYDPRVGSMHLTGCRNLYAFPNENNASLEQGQDCMIEVQVQFPPINMRWFFNQKLKITISSQRDKQDSMYFRPIVILTPPITYRWQSSQKQFIRTYEKCLRIILLIMAFLCVTYQFTHMKSTQGEASSSYISLVMLGIQLSSYFYPFITCSDITFPSADGSDSHDRTSFIQTMYHLVIYEISGIFRLVWARRAKPNSPSDIKVLIITLSIHVLGLSIFLNRAPISLFVPFEHIKAYWGLVLDLFLLPQIIANRIWRIRSKPLLKIYYIGFSLTRAFPHLYNYFRDPAYVTTAKEDLSVLHKFSDIAIAITVILFAFVVYIQQRCCSDDSPTEPASQTEIMEQQEDS